MAGCRSRTPSGYGGWKRQNRWLKKLLAEAMLDNAALRDIASGKF